MFSFRKIFKYLWVFIRPYRLAFFSLFFFIFLRISFTLLLIPYGYKSIIDVLSLNNIDVATRSNVAFLFLIPMGVGFVISTFANRYREFVYIRLLSNGIRDIYNFSFLKLTNHSYKFFSDNFSGSLVAKVKRLARAFEVINDIILGTFWFIIVFITGSTIVLYFQSKILAIYIIVWSLVYAFFVLFFVRQKIQLDIKEAEADSRITGVLSDSIANILNIKIFSSTKREFTYFQKSSDFLKDRIYAAFKFGVIRSSFQAFFMILFQVFILYTMVNLWKMGEITLGVFTLTYVYLFSIMERIWELSEGTTKFMKAMSDVKEVVDIFETEVGVRDISNPEPCRIKNGVIEFKNVSFGYTEETEVLSNFDLKIKKGEKVGLVGHSGSGKSTITKLLLRFVDISSGEILIDGQNISHITQNDLRNTVSYVPQESILFHRSIKENIGYSKNNPTDEEIIFVATRAHAHEFIISLPKGYETKVGERGVKLSGGERQRVAIARAMLKDSPILVLDEATSSLDSISESYIQEAFNELMKGKTTIVIAHRLSTIKKMDRIIVLDKGQVVEEGTHKELLEKGGLYTNLWEHQTGGFLE